MLDGSSSSVIRVDRSHSRSFRQRLAGLDSWCTVAGGREVTDSDSGEPSGDSSAYATSTVERDGGNYRW